MVCKLIELNYLSLDEFELIFGAYIDNSRFLCRIIVEFSGLS